MTSKTIEGVGFAAVGPEEDYLLTIAPNGAEDHVYASHLLPSDAKADWAHIEALMGGFGRSIGRDFGQRLCGEPEAASVSFSHRCRGRSTE